MQTGLVAGFGDPLGPQRLAEITAHGMTIIRQDIQRTNGRTPDVSAVLAEAASWTGRTVFICDEQTIYEVPDGAWVELYNEPDINGFTPSAWVRAAQAVWSYIKAHGLTFWGGGNSNLNQKSLAWLREVVRLAPWLTHITAHRYSPTAHQERMLPHKGFVSRDAEADALVSITGTRPLLIGEVGFSTQRITTGWWFFTRTTQLTAPQQADMLLDELEFWQCRGASACVLYQEQDSPDPKADQYGLRYAQPTPGTMGAWKTDTFYGDAIMNRAIAVIVRNDAGDPVAGASASMQVSQNAWVMGTTDAEGMVTWPMVANSLANTQLRVSAEGYIPVDESIILNPGNCQIRMGLPPDPGQPNAVVMPALKLAHFDPFTLTLHDLMRVRGGMWVNRAAIPYGPRPGQPDNINAMDYYEHYGPEDRALMRANYTSAGYTHAVTGPMIEPSGYHGHYPTYPGPLTQDWWDRYLDCMQEWWDNTDADGNPHPIIPVHFAVTDAPGVNIDDNMAMLEPFFLQERAQRVLRFLVLAWEPSPWTNADYVKVATWLRSVFPNAVIAVHLEPDHNAPGLSAEIADGSLTEAQMWANLAPHIHAFFPQTGNLLNNDPSDDEDFYEMFDPSVEGSWDHRFLQGYHGWPTFSANPDHGIWTIPSEYKSYKDYWENEPESVARAVGDELMRLGAHGYFDGGTVEVK